MTRRGVLAVGIVGAWIVGLAAFTHRELSRSESARMTESSLRVAPGATYFAVLRGGKHVGYASTMIDTVPLRTDFIDFLVADLPAGDSLRRHTFRSRVRLTRSLALRNYVLQWTTDSAPRVVRGNVRDSVLQHVVRSGTGGQARTVDSSHRALPSRTVATPVVATLTMVAAVPRVGRSATFATVDPLSGELRQTRVRLAAESLFVVPDSAAYDGGAARWRGVHNDSVRAWRVEGLPGTLWVDELGRTVRHERPDGLTLQRTAYELAFENWRATSPLSVRHARSVTAKP